MHKLSQASLHPTWLCAVLTISAALTVGSLCSSKAIAQSVTSLGRQDIQTQGVQTFDPSQPRAWTNSSCSTSLPQAVHSILNRSYVAQRGWGVLITSLDQGTVLYSHNADHPFIPASNTKILTTAAALQSLGPSYPVGSKPLSSWINTINTYSNNSSADFLLRQIGGQKTVRNRLWDDLGIDPSQYRQTDGSGLSRYNLVSPATLVNTLRGMSRTPNWPTFYHSLPSAGESGTLRNRLALLRGQVRAKTGTLQGVRALSGYLQHPDYGPLAFSILANQSSRPGSVLVHTIDEIVVGMARSRPCGYGSTTF
jgi:serine-type D-Ala-D-Ala carboxypeptidase/endopeptidase (penicillin-binding protein 4)